MTKQAIAPISRVVKPIQKVRFAEAEKRVLEPSVDRVLKKKETKIKYMLKPVTRVKGLLIT